MEQYIFYDEVELSLIHIWTEVFTEKDLWIIKKAEELGFETIDIAIARPESFPTELVKQELAKTNLQVVTTTTLNAETNLISPDENIRKNGIRALKKLVDINKELGSTILGGVNYAGWGCLSGKPKTEKEWNDSVSATVSYTHLDVYKRQAYYTIP